MVDLRSIVIGVIGFSLTLTLPGMLFNPAEIRSSDYEDPQVCSGCHVEIYAQWNGSMHSNAYRDPVYQKLFLTASRETNAKFDDFCTRCHAPIAYLSGEIPSAGKVSEIAGKGVSCDFCHTVNASSGIGAFESSPGKIKRGHLNDSYSTYHETAYSELHTSAELCGMCHNVQHPFNGLVLESTYAEWKEGPYNETTTCQHCHMTPGVTEFRENPGSAAAGAPVREHIYTHDIVGGNAMVAGSPEHERLARERLQAAAKVEIVNIERTNESVNLVVKVTNIGAGHKIPTGMSEARMMWLDVNIRDAFGDQIFRSGEMDDEGYIRKEAVVYHTVLGDSNGRPTGKIWLAERILLDKRIAPKGYSLENYTFTLPKNVKGPLSIDVKLNYMPISQELSDLLFGKGKVKPPVVEMASANAALDVPSIKQMPGFGSATLLTVILLLCMRIKQVGKHLYSFKTNYNSYNHE